MGAGVVGDCVGYTRRSSVGAGVGAWLTSGVDNVVLVGVGVNVGVAVGVEAAVGLGVGGGCHANDGGSSPVLR